MYGYEDTNSGETVSFDWSCMKGLAEGLACSVVRELYNLHEIRPFPEGSIDRIRKVLSEDWFLTEIVERFVSRRDAHVRANMKAVSEES